MKRIIERKQPTKYKLILSADWHLRDDTPRCRERDEYLAAQERKLKFIRDLCKENEATLLIAGDIFDIWKPSPWLISLALHYLPTTPATIVVPGQHDMVSHNIQELGKTGLQTLAEAGAIVILSGGLQRVLGNSNACLGAVYGYAYGETAQNPPKGDEGVKILMWHRLTCSGSQPWPGAEAAEAPNLVKQLNEFDLILTGDNHQSFWSSHSKIKIDESLTQLGLRPSRKTDSGGYLIGNKAVEMIRKTAGNFPGIVNPGSLCRMSSDQSEFAPAVFGWSEDGTVTRIPLPIEKGVVKATTSNAKAKESRDKRMEVYISRAAKQYETKLSFTKNLEQHFKSNKERDGVEKIVWKAVSNEK